MATSRELTYTRRDIAAQIVDDDPKRAELLFRLFAETDQRTPEGCAAREDLMQYIYSLTSHSQKSQKSFAEYLQSIAALFILFVGCSVYFIR